MRPVLAIISARTASWRYTRMQWFKSFEDAYYALDPFAQSLLN